MKKNNKSSKSLNVVSEIIVNVGVAAILSVITYGILAFVWANVGSFDTDAQINVTMLSGIVFGLAAGYRLNDIIGQK